VRKNIKIYKNFGEIFRELFLFIVTIFSFFVFCAFVSGLSLVQFFAQGFLITWVLFRVVFCYLCD